MQTPQPGVPPAWGSAPEAPQEYVEPGYGGQPGLGGYGQPNGFNPSQQPPQLGYAAPPPANYGPAPWNEPASAPTLHQTIGWIAFAIVGLLGLLGAVLTLTLWINMNSAVSRASDVCNRFGGEFSNMCLDSIKHAVPTIPTVLVVCMFLIIGACLAATAGAIMLFLKRPMGQFLILGGGIVMLVLAIGCEARYGATGRITYDLVTGVVIAVIGGLMFVPAFRVVLGLPPKLTSNPWPNPVPVGGQWPYGQPVAPQSGPPGPGGYPPPHW
jgi:hypothetical protein